MSDIVNPFMQSVGQMFATRNQYEYEKEMKINEDILKNREKFREAVGEERVGMWMIYGFWFKIYDYI